MLTNSKDKLSWSFVLGKFYSLQRVDFFREKLRSKAVGTQLGQEESRIENVNRVEKFKADDVVERDRPTWIIEPAYKLWRIAVNS